MTNQHGKVGRAHPKRPDVRLALARSLANEGRWEETLIEANAVIEVRPLSQPAIILSLRAAIELERISEVHRLWTALSRMDPTAVIRWMRILARQARYNWAVAAFQGLSEGRGTSSEVLAERNWLIGYLSVASREHSLIAPDSNGSLAADALATILAKAGMAPSSSSDLAKTSGVEPVVQAIQTITTMDHSHRAKLEAADDAKHPVRFEASIQPEAERAKNEADEAQWRRLLQAKYVSARVAADERKHLEVICILDGLEVLPKHREGSIKLLARAFWFTKEYSKALDYWRLAAEIDPRHPASWLFIARCCRMLGLRAEGRAATLRRLELTPGDANAEKLLHEFDN